MLQQNYLIKEQQMENRIFNIAIVDDETEILDLLNRF